MTRTLLSWIDAKLFVWAEILMALSLVLIAII